MKIHPVALEELRGQKMHDLSKCHILSKIKDYSENTHSIGKCDIHLQL